MVVPTQPRTTYNIGKISGGTSVNTIAQYAELELDLRSEGTGELQNVVEQTLAIVKRYQVPAWVEHAADARIHVLYPGIALVITVQDQDARLAEVEPGQQADGTDQKDGDQQGLEARSHSSQKAIQKGIEKNNEATRAKFMAA